VALENFIKPSKIPLSLLSTPTMEAAIIMEMVSMVSMVSMVCRALKSFIELKIAKHLNFKL
jgi:hypothetical protein